MLRLNSIMIELLEIYANIELIKYGPLRSSQLNNYWIDRGMYINWINKVWSTALCLNSIIIELLETYTQMEFTKCGPLRSVSTQ